MKIRMDFVTNSSSSSFVIEISIKTHNGVRHTYTSSELNIEVGYPPCTIAVSPKQLAQSENIHELCQMLRHSAYIGADESDLPPEYTTRLKTPTGASKFIKKLEEEVVFSEISEISISGEEIFSPDAMWLRKYSYRISDGLYTLLEIGNQEELPCLIESAEGRGGGLVLQDHKEAVLTCMTELPLRAFAEAIEGSYPNLELVEQAELSTLDKQLENQEAIPISLLIKRDGQFVGALLLADDQASKSKLFKATKNACKQVGIPVVTGNPTKPLAVSDVMKKLKKVLSASMEPSLDALKELDPNEPAAAVPQEGNGWSVRVKFIDKRSYNYNCFTDVAVGDIVYVSGARMGISGMVVEVLEQKTYPGYQNVKRIVKKTGRCK